MTIRTRAFGQPAGRHPHGSVPAPQQAANAGLHRLACRFASSEVESDGTFTGYGSVFAMRDSYGDVVLPGTFRASLDEHARAGTRPKGLWQHDPNEPILTWLEMREDDKGLYCKGRLLLDLQKARDAHVLMKAGELDGLSIGFEVGEHEMSRAEDVEMRFGCAPYWGPGGPVGMVRVVKSVALWEVSLVTFPALAGARIDSVRRAPPQPALPVAVIAALARRQQALGRLLAD